MRQFRVREFFRESGRWDLTRRIGSSDITLLQKTARVYLKTLNVTGSEEFLR